LLYFLLHDDDRVGGIWQREAITATCTEHIQMPLAQVEEKKRPTNKKSRPGLDIYRAASRRLVSTQFLFISLANVVHAAPFLFAAAMAVAVEEGRRSRIISIRYLSSLASSWQHKIYGFLSL
jgi:hypothetical protein